MIKLKTGEPYPFPLPDSEGASANFLSKNGNTLQIQINNLSKIELLALKKGKIEAGFLYESGDLLWLFRFYHKTTPIFTLDAPFDARLIPKDLLSLHSIINDEQRLVIDIHAIDNKIIKVLRSVTMPNKLTIEFLEAVQEQLTTHTKGRAIENWLQADINTLFNKVNNFKIGT